MSRTKIYKIFSFQFKLKSSIKAETGKLKLLLSTPSLPALFSEIYLHESACMHAPVSIDWWSVVGTINE